MKRLVLAIVLIAAACTSGSDSANPETTTTLATTTTTAAPTTTEAPLRVEHGPPAEDLIAVLTGGGDLVVMDALGANSLTLASSADARITQPVWSPDGTRLAWTQATPAAFGGTDFALVTANTDGGDPTTIATPFPPFYASWDPTSTTVAFLGSSGGAVGLGIADAGFDGTAVQIDQSSPYYFVWDPFGTTMLAHAGASLRLVTPAGQVSEFTIGNGVYQVPGVVGTSNQIVFAEGSPDLGVVALGNVATGDLSVLAGYQGQAWLQVDPTGERVAVSTAHRGPEGDPAEVDPAELDFQLLAEGLDVIDIVTKEATRITDRPPIAYFWSPDGQRILFLSLEAVDEVAWFQWSVWDDDGSITVGDLFQPSAEFGSSILPFYDQYSVSHDLWAPDSQRFTFAGTTIGGESGAWVVDTQSNQSTLISEGATLAFWSPTGAS